MATPKQELKVFDFSGGMNTELGLVNTDEKTAKNIENIELKADGSAERRSGIALLETTLMDSDAQDLSSPRGHLGWVYPAPTMHVWRTINGDDVSDFFMLGGVDTDTSGNPSITIKELINGISDLENWSSGAGQTVIDLSSVYVNVDAGNYRYRYTEAGSLMVITNEETEPFLLLGSDATAANPIKLKIRDPNSVEVDSVVQNNNIVYSCIETHTSGSTTEPGVGANWRRYWVALGGATSETAWATSTSYTSNIDILWSVLGFDPTGSMEKHVTHSIFIGGRIWYTGVPAAPTTLYVTQPLKEHRTTSASVDETGFCFSVNDPYSVTDSSPSAADGGTIQIREAGIIQSIAAYREGLLIFATNGVWSIPNAGNFNATNFDVLKLSDVAIIGPDAFVETDFGVVYFGRNSVQLIGITDNGNQVAQEISQPIKSFYNTISEFSKETSFILYNKNEQRVYWFTTFTEPEYSLANGPYQTANKTRQPCATQDILVFDFKLRAWYKHTRMRKDVDLVETDLMIASAITYIGDFGEEAIIINSAGDTLINSSGDTLISSSFDGTNTQEFTLMLVTGKKTVSSGADVFRYGIAHMQGDLDQDFGNIATADAALKSTFDSELLSQHLNFADLGHQKQTPTIHTVFRRVETGTLDASGNDITPGGCLLQTNWNWASGTQAGAKYGTAFQAYRPYRWNISPASGSLPDIEGVVNKHRLRGRGKVLQFRFTNDGNKRFHLLGFQLEVEATRKV